MNLKALLIGSVLLAGCSGTSSLYRYPPGEQCAMGYDPYPMPPREPSTPVSLEGTSNARLPDGHYQALEVDYIYYEPRPKVDPRAELPSDIAVHAKKLIDTKTGEIKSLAQCVRNSTYMEQGFEKSMNLIESMDVTSHGVTLTPINIRFQGPEPKMRARVAVEAAASAQSLTQLKDLFPGFEIGIYRMTADAKAPNMYEIRGSTPKGQTPIHRFRIQLQRTDLPAAAAP